MLYLLDTLVQTTYLTLANIPLIAVYKKSKANASQNGCIICYHGFSSSKDAWLNDLKAIAEHGFMVIGVDNVGHGARRYSDFDERFAQEKQKTDEQFIQIVKETASELPALINSLLQEQLALANKLAAFGVSMGGFITYAAILKEPRLKAAATLVSSPEWWMANSKDSPHHHIEEFKNIKLLSMTAGKDDVVPRIYAQRFHDRLKERFDDYAQRFTYLNYEASNHMMNPNWDDAIEQMLSWFKRHL